MEAQETTRLVLIEDNETVGWQYCFGESKAEPAWYLKTGDTSIWLADSDCQEPFDALQFHEAKSEATDSHFVLCWGQVLNAWLTPMCLQCSKPLQIGASHRSCLHFIVSRWVAATAACCSQQVGTIQLGRRLQMARRRSMGTSLRGTSKAQQMAADQLRRFVRPEDAVAFAIYSAGGPREHEKTWKNNACRRNRLMWQFLYVFINWDKVPKFLDVADALATKSIHQLVAQVTCAAATLRYWSTMRGNNQPRLEHVLSFKQRTWFEKSRYLTPRTSLMAQQTPSWMNCAQNSDKDGVTAQSKSILRFLICWSSRLFHSGGRIPASLDAEVVNTDVGRCLLLAFCKCIRHTVC